MTRPPDAEERELDPVLLDPALEDRALEAWLAEVRDAEAGPAADLPAMLREVEAEIAREEAKKTAWLRSRPTTVRRTIALGALLTLALVLGVLTTARAPAELLWPPIAGGALALAALLALAVHQALRPLHRPAMSRSARIGAAALTLSATFALALLTPHGEAAHESVELLAHVGPCLFVGLLVGAATYVVLRLLDRGEASTSLLAACAAGLLGDLVLQLHCPRGDLAHLMLGHFAVALLFVAGLGGVLSLWKR